MENEIKNEKTDNAKEKIILFIIGVLVGAVISTAAFFVYAKTLSTSSSTGGPSSGQMQSGTPPEMPSGDNSEGGQSGTPPEKPSDNNSESNNN